MIPRLVDREAVGRAQRRRARGTSANRPCPACPHTARIGLSAAAQPERRSMVSHQVFQRFGFVAVVLSVVSCGGNDTPAPVNQAPVASIGQPAVGSTFRAGDTVTFSGSATDVEDGALAAARLTWWAELHHDTHSHPFQPETAGAGGHGDDSDAGRDLGQHLLPLPLARHRQRRRNARGHARCPAAKGADHAEQRARRARADARRPADHGADHGHGRGRHRTQPGCRRPEPERPALPVLRLERRWRGHAHDLDAGGQHHVHGQLHRHRAGREQPAHGRADGTRRWQHRYGRRRAHALRRRRPTPTAASRVSSSSTTA